METKPTNGANIDAAMARLVVPGTNRLLPYTGCILCSDTSHARAVLTYAHKQYTVLLCANCISVLAKECGECARLTFNREFRKLGRYSACLHCVRQCKGKCSDCGRPVVNNGFIPNLCRPCYKNAMAIYKPSIMLGGTLPGLAQVAEETYNKTLGIKRPYGVEVECYNPELPSNEARDEDDTDWEDVPSVSGWQYTEDGSISGSGLGIEYYSKVLQGDSGIDRVNRLCAVLAQEGFTVNHTCGLHVHTDASDLTPDHLLNIASQCYIWEPVIYSLLPKSRRKNTYSRPLGLRASEITGFDRTRLLKLKRFEDEGRYFGLNLTAYSKHGTIEFRYHSGTISAHKIINWIVFCLALVEYAKRKKPPMLLSQYPVNVESLSVLLNLLKLPEEQKVYWKARQEGFLNETITA